MDKQIIGGADGSTSIFLGGISWYIIAIVAVICIGIIAFFVGRKNINN